MKRREFITLLGGAAAAWPLAARAQQPATQPRIAIFHAAIPTTLLTETGGGSGWRAFFGELRRLGYVEGKNLIIERYSAKLPLLLIGIGIKAPEGPHQAPDWANSLRSA